MPSLRPLPAVLAALSLVLALVTIAFGSVSARPSSAALVAQATPAAYSCETTATPAATPTMGDMAGMDHGAMADEAELPEFDQVYIDMMIPHHGSVVALAQVALPLLENQELQIIAQDIITSQQDEQQMLETWRETWYGSARPESMDAIMPAMMAYMPEAHDLMMADMDLMMADALVARFCAAENADLAFIDLVIPHHKSAIAASEPAVTDAVHQEVRDFAQDVIDAQQAEIDLMMEIRTEIEAA